MSDIRFTRPITTGSPALGSSQVQRQKPGAQQEGASFQEVLRQLQQSQQTLDQGIEQARAEAPLGQEVEKAVVFSKHAAQRVQQRGIELGESQMARLSEGVRLAGQKGLGDTLILMDRTAFLVNVHSGKVITALEGGELQGNVFTNIDGTVII